MRTSIEIVVSPKGDVKVETKGFTGGDCRAASKTLEEALGIKASDQVTAEFYQHQATQTQQQQHS